MIEKKKLTMNNLTTQNFGIPCCKYYKYLINDYKSVMTRSEYRKLQQKIGCPLSALLVMLPLTRRLRATGGARRGCRAGERAVKGCGKLWPQRRGRRRRKGFVGKQKHKRDLGCLKERLLECPLTIEIPDPNPTRLPDEIFAPTACSSPRLAVAPDPTTECVPAMQPLWLRHVIKNELIANELTSKLPSSQESCISTTNQKEMFEVPEPTWRQWNIASETIAKTSTRETVQCKGTQFQNSNLTGEGESRDEQFLDVLNDPSEITTSAETSRNSLIGEGGVPQQSDALAMDRQEEPIDVETADDEVNTMCWSVENMRGSAASDMQEDDVDVESMEHDPSMTVPDEWCDACRKRLAPSAEILSLSRRYRVAKWIGSLLGFMGLVTSEEVHHVPLLGMTPMHGPGTSSTGPSSTSHSGLFS